jgi:protease I|tara:strand:- start:852 stop:1361 length:510 start_codon:yes stop_codon:yes gene_type:complete
MKKKVVFIIAHTKFRDEELLEPKKILKENGVNITIASSSLKIAEGMLGIKIQPDILIKDIKVENYDAIIFIGGTGASEYWNNKTAHYIASETLEKNKILAAICIAPITIANAGLLIGKKATVYQSEINKIKDKKAIYTDSKVERDGNIITAQDPSSANEFGKAILSAIK